MNFTNNISIKNNDNKIINQLAGVGINNVKEEILIGLQAEQKYISPKYFYDSIGSELFEEITFLEEYYPTRTEKSILESFVKDLAIDFKDLNIMELGSGDPTKISLLLQQINDNTLQTINYFPIDISQSAVEKSMNILNNRFYINNITGIIIDFMHQLNLIPKEGKRLFCFFGSTLGNFNIEERKSFIQNLSTEMKSGDNFILGIDLVKDISILEKAYNDKQGITAAFNKNILNVIANITNIRFTTDDFEHYAFFNTTKNRIEMHLRAIRNTDILINSSKYEKISLAKGETIHTENSHKFTEENIREISETGNFDIIDSFVDKNNWFKVIHFRK